jgi:hypothetical protein
MKSYYQTINTIVQNTVNMPNPKVHPAKFIEWAEDICIVVSEIYDKDYDTVTDDLKEALGLLEDNE